MSLLCISIIIYAFPYHLKYQKKFLPKSLIFLLHNLLPLFSHKSRLQKEYSQCCIEQEAYNRLKKQKRKRKNFMNYVLHSYFENLLLIVAGEFKRALRWEVLWNPQFRKCLKWGRRIHQNFHIWPLLKSDLREGYN